MSTLELGQVLENTLKHIHIPNDQASVLPSIPQQSDNGNIQPLVLKKMSLQTFEELNRLLESYHS